MEKDKKRKKDERQNFSWQKILLVLTLTTLIFVIGLVIGNAVANQKLDIINHMEQDLRTETTAVELQFQLLADNPCIALNYSPLTEELYNIATRLDYMENSLGEDNKDVIRLKNYYSTLQIRHYLLLKKMQTECNQNLSLMLYFYDTKEDCPKCEQQGFILTYLRKKNPNIYVYAFYKDLENAAMKTLKTMYGIDETPAVVVDGYKVEGFIKKDELIDIIDCNGKCE